MRRHDQGVRRADGAARGAGGRARARAASVVATRGRRAAARSLGPACARTAERRELARPRRTGAIRDAALAALAYEASTTETHRGRATVRSESSSRCSRADHAGDLRRRPHRGGTGAAARKSLGYRTVVADGGPAFLTRERFPDADELILAWPEEAFAKIGPRRGELRLHPVPRSQVRRAGAGRSRCARRRAYVGAIGSRKTQASRRERLSGAGFDRRRAWPGCTGRSASTSAAGSRRRPRWRFWRR